MHHNLLLFFLQVEESPCDAFEDLKPLTAAQLPPSSMAEEESVQAAIGHVLVHKVQLLVPLAPAFELHQVPVPRPA